MYVDKPCIIVTAQIEGEAKTHEEVYECEEPYRGGPAVNTQEEAEACAKGIFDRFNATCGLASAPAAWSR